MNTSPRPQQRAEARFNVTTEFPRYDLHHAAASGNLGLVEFALSHGQPINSVLNGVLPLHAACAGGSVAVVQYLIDEGADVNAAQLPRRYSNDRASTGGLTVGASGSTPLHFAAFNGHMNIVRLLLDNGAHPDRPDKYGITPEMLARENGWIDCADLLCHWAGGREVDLPPPVTAPDLLEQELIKCSFDSAVAAAGLLPMYTCPRRLLSKRSMDSAALHLSRYANPTQRLSSIPPTPVDGLVHDEAGDTISRLRTPRFYGEHDKNVDDGELFALRRPSLPHLHVEHESPFHKRVSGQSRRPRSAGTGAITHRFDAADARRLGTKRSLLGAFKKAQGDFQSLPNTSQDMLVAPYSRSRSPSSFSPMSPTYAAPAQPTPPDLGRHRTASRHSSLRHCASASDLHLRFPRSKVDEASPVPPRAKVCTEITRKHSTDRGCDVLCAYSFGTPDQSHKPPTQAELQDASLQIDIAHAQNNSESLRDPQTSYVIVRLPDSEETNSTHSPLPLTVGDASSNTADRATLEYGNIGTPHHPRFGSLMREIAILPGGNEGGYDSSEQHAACQRKGESLDSSRLQRVRGHSISSSTTSTSLDAPLSQLSKFPLEMTSDSASMSTEHSLASPSTPNVSQSVYSLSLHDSRNDPSPVSTSFSSELSSPELPHDIAPCSASTTQHVRDISSHAKAKELLAQVQRDVYKTAHDDADELRIPLSEKLANLGELFALERQLAVGDSQTRSVTTGDAHYDKRRNPETQILSCEPLLQSGAPNNSKGRMLPKATKMRRPHTAEGTGSRPRETVFGFEDRVNGSRGSLHRKGPPSLSTPVVCKVQSEGSCPETFARCICSHPRWESPVIPLTTEFSSKQSVAKSPPPALHNDDNISECTPQVARFGIPLGRVSTMPTYDSSQTATVSSRRTGSASKLVRMGFTPDQTLSSGQSTLPSSRMRLGIKTLMQSIKGK